MDNNETYVEEISNLLRHDKYDEAVALAKEFQRDPSYLSDKDFSMDLDYELDDDADYKQYLLYRDIGIDTKEFGDELLGLVVENYDSRIVDVVFEICPEEIKAYLTDLADNFISGGNLCDDEDILKNTIEDLYSHCGKEYVDNIFINSMKGVSDFCGQVDSAINLCCSKYLLICMALSSQDDTSEKILAINKILKKAEKCGELDECVETLVSKAKEWRESGSSLNEVFWIYELALKNGSEDAYEDIISFCNPYTDNEDADSGLILDVLTLTAKYMPHHASEIADIIIDADNPTENVSKIELQWYSEAYRLDKQKKKRIDQILKVRCSSKKEYARYKKKILKQKSKKKSSKIARKLNKLFKSLFK